MRALRQVTTVRFEVDLEVAVGELNYLEDEFVKQTPKDFLAAWLPEVRDVRMMIKFKEKVYDAEKHYRDKRASRRAKQLPLPFSPEAD